MTIGSKKRGASILFTIGCSLALLGGGPVFADKKGEQEEAEKDLDKAEKGQKKGGGQQAPGGGQNPFENPLEKILDLMKGVEEKLFEADTGDFTQSEQKKIVEAMRFEDKTKKALDKLIDKIENSQQQSSSSSSSSSQSKKNQKKNKSQKNQRNQQQKSKEQQQREKEQEAKRQAQKQKQQQNKQQQSEQDKKKSEAQKKKEQEQKRKAEQEKKMAQQRKRNGRPPNDKSGDLNEDMGAAGRWGSLPAKLFQDAQNVRNRATPSRYRRLIERYRERISGKKSE